MFRFLLILIGTHDFSSTNFFFLTFYVLILVEQEEIDGNSFFFLYSFTVMLYIT